MTKRLFDLACASCGLLICPPFFLIIGTLIKLDSPGPVFYCSRRMGKNGRVFEMLVFRTMATNPGLLTPGTPRVTGVGRFLRNYSLDHWPALYNVLKGDMSIVGPRPEIPEFVDLEDETWQQVLSVKPGIFSLAVRTFGEQYNHTSLPAKQKLELLYIQKQSLLFDMWMVLTSVLTAIRKGNVKGKT